MLSYIIRWYGFLQEALPVVALFLSNCLTVKYELKNIADHYYTKSLTCYDNAIRPINLPLPFKQQ